MGGAVAGNRLARPDFDPEVRSAASDAPGNAAQRHTPGQEGLELDYYRIGVRQFDQEILPDGMGLGHTTVWSYGSVDHPETFNYPAFTIEATWGRPVRVKWINELLTADGRFRPHLLPVDQTLHWANPSGGSRGRDSHGHDQTPYRGPVPIVTHLHGGHSDQQSDGYPEAWYLPKARNIPGGFAKVGSKYQEFRALAQAALGQAWTPGSAVFQYDNNQRASTMWYHDHTLGMTRLNVYAGPAGFYLLRGGPDDAVGGTLPGPAPALGDPPGRDYFEIPLAIQDRSFTEDGELFYPDSRAFFEGLAPSELQIPFWDDPACGGPSDVAPIWNPEFFGNTMLVNGRTWPSLEVAAAALPLPSPERLQFALPDPATRERSAVLADRQRGRLSAGAGRAATDPPRPGRACRRDRRLHESAGRGRDPPAQHRSRRAFRGRRGGHRFRAGRSRDNRAGDALQRRPERQP